MKKIIVLVLAAFISVAAFSQDSTSTKQTKKERKQQQKKEEQAREDAITRQQEEGVLVFSKQTAGGIMLRTNGYGAFLEIGRKRSPRWGNLFLFELTEIKHNKEEKSSGDGFFSNSFVYGKINNFYQAKLGFGQQYIFGQKGNKNGIAVLGIVHGGLSVGLAKPYYIKNRETGRDMKYESADSLDFLDYSKIAGGSGFTKGFSEIKIKPGVFLKGALRFDFGRFNETINALEIGISVDYYASKISQMAYNEPKNIFVQGHVAYVFGKRK